MIGWMFLKQFHSFHNNLALGCKSVLQFNRFTMGNENYVHTADGQPGDPGLGCVCKIQLGLGQTTTGTDEWRTT